MNHKDIDLAACSDDQLKELLHGTMLLEQAAYKKKLSEKTGLEVLEEGYAYFSREDILVCVETGDLSREQMLALLSVPSPLAAVYEEWLAKDCSQMEDIREALESCANHLMGKAA